MTVSNPIGFAKSDQKYECIYAAITNLPPRLRFSRHAIQLVELTNSKAFKHHSAARVLCGVDVDGKQIDEPCFAADLRRLQEGVELRLPYKDGRVDERWGLNSVDVLNSNNRTTVGSANNNKLNVP